MKRNQKLDPSLQQSLNVAESGPHIADLGPQSDPWFYSNAAAFEMDLRSYASSIPITTDYDGHIRLPGHLPFKWQLPVNRLTDAGLRRQLYEETATLVVAFLIDRFHPKVFFDIGAAYGYFSMVAASRIDRPPQVHAFEMRPDRFERLQLASDGDDIEQRVHKHLAGISDQHRGPVDIWFSRHRLFEYEPTKSESEGPWHARLKFFLRRDRSRALTKGEVLVTTIDHFCSASGVEPDLLKIDVDGYEGKVLRGAQRILSRKKPMVLLELHRDKLIRGGGTRIDAVSTLFDLGYQAFYFTNHKSFENCQIISVEPGDPLLARQHTDHILFVPRA